MAAQQLPQNAPTAPGQQPGIMQQATDPLAQLRDIHQPVMIEAWPPAIGWWVLAALGLIGVTVLVIWLMRRWLDNRYRREALAELGELKASWQSHQSDLQYLEELQLLLKRVALTKFPRAEVASLTGEAWVNFLDRSTGSHDFTIGVAEALIDGNYRQSISVDIAELETLATDWIKKHHHRHLAESQSTDDSSSTPESGKEWQTA